MGYINLSSVRCKLKTVRCPPLVLCVQQAFLNQ